MTVDGRQSASRGLTLRETAQLMKRLGADDALNLDGGGSSTMLARESGEGPRIVNAPSDGRLRPVANGLGFSVTNGSGRLRGLRIEPDRDAADSHRVLRGLSRVLVSRGHDEGFDPVGAKPGWRGSERVSVRRTAAARTVAVGRGRGVGSVTAQKGSATGRFRLTVLGRVHRLETNVPRIALAGRNGARSFDLRGYDTRGFGTWIQPRDVRLRYDRDALAVRRTGKGFSVRAKVRSTSEVIRVSAGGKHTFVGVTVGLARRVADRMNTLRGWSADARPSAASARLGPANDRAGRAGRAIALRCSFGRSRKTRVASLEAAGGREIAGRARRVGVWVRGDGRGALLRLVAKDAGGRRATLDLARRVTWKGWRLVTAPLPGGLAEPVKVLRLYAAEPERTRRYSGRLVFDDLAVWTERTAPVPVTAPLRDPLVRASSALPAGGLRVAVLGDARVRAAKPDSPAVRRTRRAMRKAVAANAGLVLIDGDLVGHGGAADLRLARRLVEEELAEAATDDSVGAVVVVAHHPTSDPSPGGTSELADSREGDLVEDLLAGFRASSGKKAGYVASHTRRFGMVRDDDVPTVLTGAIDTPARVGPGSFAGWSMLRLEPDAVTWLGVELRPTVDRLRLSAPSAPAVGTSAPVSAVFRQDGRYRQLRYPMTAVWGGSRTLFVGKAGQAPRHAVAAYTPTTGKLTALRRGQATLSLEVNGATAERTLTVR